MFPLLFLGVCIYRVLSKKEALISNFGITGVKSGLPRTSPVILSKLCRLHPRRLSVPVIKARHLSTFEDLSLNFAGCTDSVEDRELLPTGLLCRQLANCLRAAHSSAIC